MDLDRYYAEVRNFYHHPKVKETLWRFFEGAEYAVGFGRYLTDRKWKLPKVVPVRELDSLCDMGLDLFRPLRDREDRVLLVVMDYEFYTLDDLYFLYNHQLDVFRRIYQISDFIDAGFRRYGIQTITDMTASGGHVLSQIPRDSESFRQISALGFVEPSVRNKYDISIHNDPNEIKRKRPVPIELGLAYNGLGKLLEFFCHGIIQKARGQIDYPITFCDAASGDIQHPRKGFSLDLSQYCDPIFMRVIRSVASAHQKHLLRHLMSRPPAIDIIRNQQPVEELVETMWNIKLARTFFEQHQVETPCSAEGWPGLIQDYRNSRLAQVHQDFDARETPADELLQLRERLRHIPPCIQNMLQAPNPEMLKPTNIQFLTKLVKRFGFHAKAAADFIIAHYRNSAYNWHENNNCVWHKYDPYSRANTYVRFYHGLLECGIDGYQDMRCEVHKRKGFCPVDICEFQLEEFAG
jgi:hypothetical protein